MEKVPTTKLFALRRGSVNAATTMKTSAIRLRPAARSRLGQDDGHAI